MRTHITPVQLFFLTFSYLLSGFFLYHLTSYYAVIAHFALFSLFAVFCARGLSRQRSGLFEFVSAYVPGSFGIVFAGLFLVISVFQTIQTVVLFGNSVERFCDFLPWWMIFIVLCFSAVYTVYHGMSAIGRFAELVPFLLVPILFIRPFGNFMPLLSAKSFDVSAVFSGFSAVPVFFLASKTAVAGDAGISEALQVRSKMPADRSSYLIRIMIAGAAAAALVYFYLMLFSFGERDILIAFLTWMLHIIRLFVLVGIYADLVTENQTPKLRTAFTVVFSVSVMMVFAFVWGGIFEKRFYLDAVFAGIDYLLPVVLNIIPLFYKKRAVEIE